MIKVTPNERRFHLVGVTPSGNRETLARDLRKVQIDPLQEALQGRVDRGDLMDYLKLEPIVRLERIRGDWK